jgi:hypothetical protein
MQIQRGDRRTSGTAAVVDGVNAIRNFGGIPDLRDHSDQGSSVAAILNESIVEFRLANSRGHTRH